MDKVDSQVSSITASVCTGAFVGGSRCASSQGLLTHWEDQAMLKSAYPALCVLEECALEDEGTIVTSEGYPPELI